MDLNKKKSSKSSSSSLSQSKSQSKSQSDSQKSSQSTSSDLKLVDKLKYSLYNTTLERNKIKEIYKSLDTNNKNYRKDLNVLVNNTELFNREDLQSNTRYNHLYPHLDDPNFNVKISKKLEFYNNRNQTKIVDDIEEHADKICNAKFELTSHQQFIKNFLSFNTPYNGALLYHGLGTGKTCSAIGIAEETREYMIQLNINQKIIIVASPNVQINFRQQLFDERKLEFVNGSWNIENCVGNKFLKELNLSAYKNISKTKIASQINGIINNYYKFVGYTEFANEITKIAVVNNKMLSEKQKQEQSNNQLKRYFSNRLIIIDEVQNIRISDDNKNKLVAQELTKLVDVVSDLKLVLLSATPLYNTYTEIIWLINLLNKNDNRSEIEIDDIFDENGEFKINDRGEEIGKQLLQRKSTGYISFVKGDNPYTFPYRIWPSDFDNKNSIFNLEYPKNQLNDKQILEKINHIDIFINNINTYQEQGYNYIIDYIKHKKEDIFNAKESKKQLKFSDLNKFGYTMLQKPIEALNMIYPVDGLGESIEKKQYDIDPIELIGKNGLNRLMSYEETTAPQSRTNYVFKTDKFGNIFDYENIGKYSCKIKTILDSIMNSTGVVLVYSNYIDGGAIPLALALESLGFNRYGDVNNLFKTAPTESIDALTFMKKSDMSSKSRSKSSEFNPANYVMITGDKTISPNNAKDLNACTNIDNTNGAKVKVIIISKAAAEGLDFKYIRQVHILDPWYNMNRIEQIIGRGVRHCSHKNLPLTERNVQIFLHGTKLTRDNEATDLYVYRLAEMKAVQIGKITRLLKSISIDCILNSNQQNFRENILNKTIDIVLSNKKLLKYKIGDKPFTAACDYMDNCYYKCVPDYSLKELQIDNSTYSLPHIEMNNEVIIQRIKNLIRERYFYYKRELVSLINLQREYSLEQIDSALTELINNKNHILVDKYERLGNLINIDDLYIFQPIELLDNTTSLYSKMNPIEYKPQKIHYDIEQRFADIEKDKNIDKSVKGILLEGQTRDEQKTDLTRQLEENDKLASKIIKQIQDNYNLIISEQLLVRGEENYYKSISVVIQNLVDTQKISRELLYEFGMAHIIETLEFQEIVILLNYLYNKAASSLNEIEHKIFDYFDSRIISNKGIRGLILQKNNEVVIVVISRDNLWNLAESEDYKDLKPKIDELSLPIEVFNKLVGFIGSFKGEFNIFRVKQMDKKRNKGARCDQSGKAEALKILNEIVGEPRYTAENTKKFNQHLICIYQELYLRLFDSEGRGDKRWFFYPGEALVNNIEHISI